MIPLCQAAGREAGEPIWRLEFEFKRQMLTQKGLSKLTDVLANMNGLWSYATTEWLKLTIPNPEDKTRSRWAIHPLWAALATMDWETSGGALKQRFSNERLPKTGDALNAPTESLWGSLKVGRLHGRRFTIRREAMDEVIDLLMFL